MNQPARSPAVSRRAMLGSLGALAGAALVDDAVASVSNPAAAVADRTSSIRITGLQPHICGDRVYLKIETNHEFFGWGEIKGVVPEVAAALVTSMATLLLDENPTRIEHLWQVLYRSHRNQRGGPFMMHCISGIDMALWDITGKLWGVPVYRLLGGPVRDRIRYYPGPKAVKLGSAPRPHVGDPVDVRDLISQVRAARERVGPDGTVMFDAHSAIPPALVMQFASSIEAYDLLFIEEPAVPGNIQVFKKLREKINVPIATGERVRTIWEVLPYLVGEAVDVLQPDSGYTGGISQMKKIATLAEAWYVPLAPHCTQSYLGTTASFHVAASVPYFLIHETYEHDVLGKVARRSWVKQQDGHATLPEGTGLCVDVDEAMLAKVARDPGRKFTWPRYRYPDGSVADY